MRYATAATFRQALDDRLKSEATCTGLPLARLRKQVAFELFLRRSRTRRAEPVREFALRDRPGGDAFDRRDRVVH
jgi:hypothetical protein